MEEVVAFGVVVCELSASWWWFASDKPRDRESRRRGLRGVLANQRFGFLSTWGMAGRENVLVLLSASLHPILYAKVRLLPDGGPHQYRGNFGPGGRVGLIRII